MFSFRVSGRGLSDLGLGFRMSHYPREQPDRRNVPSNAREVRQISGFELSVSVEC